MLRNNYENGEYDSIEKDLFSGVVLPDLLSKYNIERVTLDDIQNLLD